MHVIIVEKITAFASYVHLRRAVAQRKQICFIRESKYLVVVIFFIYNGILAVIANT
jgi:hypothetical protein